VAQIPSLLLSTATAVIVTRVSGSQNMGQQVLKQLFGRPRVLAITGVILGVMGAVPGMPNAAFLFLASLCGGAAWLLSRRQHQREQAAQARADAADGGQAPPARRVELSWDDVAQLDSV